MATQTKRPRRTADRTLHTSLELFTRFGQPNRSPALNLADPGTRPAHRSPPHPPA